MMINKRLIGMVGESKKYIAGNVILQWLSLAANIAMMTSITYLFQELFRKTADAGDITAVAVTAVLAVLIRFVCTAGSSRMGYLSSKAVKRTLRDKIYRKLLRLGASYSEQVSTSETVQVAVEGVDQLETYFGAYLPQFFYAMLAPLTLFVYLCFVNVPSAVLLLICVPLIPVAIAAVQTWAKKLLSKYWGQYTALGDTFLENLQGLTTLKIYQADDRKNVEMNSESEKFRRITMKVLTMQLNSITIMDLIAYGGAALGVIMAATQYAAGSLSLAGCFLIILLAADFFIPMRQLGSYFHIAMNGMAASDKIFRLLDLPEAEEKTEEVPLDCSVVCSELRFSYDEGREILHGVNMSFPKGSFTSVVGESGCGKSTLAAVLMGRNRGYTGTVKIAADKSALSRDNPQRDCVQTPAAGLKCGNADVGAADKSALSRGNPQRDFVQTPAAGLKCGNADDGTELSEISEASLMQNFTYVGHRSCLFKGTVRENLLMGKPDADDGELWAMLERVRLDGFLRTEDGLDTLLAEKGGNFSGGQCQRLALARALLHDSPVYIFDEAASNIDVESENDIMREIYGLSGKKTVILISHRLANVTKSDNIYVMEKGAVVESGTHDALLGNNGAYARLWNAQQSLENYGKEGWAE